MGASVVQHHCGGSVFWLRKSHWHQATKPLYGLPTRPALPMQQPQHEGEVNFPRSSPAHTYFSHFISPNQELLAIVGEHDDFALRKGSLAHAVSASKALGTSVGAAHGIITCRGRGKSSRRQCCKPWLQDARPFSNPPLANDLPGSRPARKRESPRPAISLRIDLQAGSLIGYQ